MNQISPDKLVLPQQRLLSLDALRGLDMLCIIGLEDIIREWSRLTEARWVHALAEQFEHVPWAGVHLYDLIFPLFMFLSGVAMPLSLDSRVEQGSSRLMLWRKILLRTGVLILLGMLYNGVFAATPAGPRFASVLGQIGLAWGITATVFLLVRETRWRFAIFGGWLVAVASLHLLFPVPGHGAGVLTADGSINSWVDRLLLPGRLHGGNFDPEGLLSILFAVPLTMAGALTGGFLKEAEKNPWKFVYGLALVGIGSVGLGMLSSFAGYPPIKSLWTATFDLYAIGISAILFALFYAVIDVLRYQSWSFVLRVIGMNALTIYLGSRLISFPKVADLVFGRLSSIAGEGGPLVLLCGVLLLQWLVLYFFYRKRWFLRV